jgi:hypothetical protein
MAKPPTSQQGGTALDKLWAELAAVYADARKDLGEPKNQRLEPEQLARFAAADRKAVAILKRIRKLN